MASLTRAQDRYVRLSAHATDNVINPGRYGASQGAVDRIVSAGLWEPIEGALVRGVVRPRYQMTEAGRRYCDD